MDNKNKPKIALTRGFWLNPFEMQYYEPLKKFYDIKAFTTYDHIFNINEIDLPIEKFHSVREIGMGIPKFQGLCDRALRKIFKSEFYNLGLTSRLKGFDIIHAVETFNIFSYQAVRAKKKYGGKVVLSVSENIPFINEDCQNSEKIKSYVRENADYFVAIADKSKQCLMIEGVDENKIEVIGHGLDIEKFCPKEKSVELLKQFSISPNDMVVLFIGQLLWLKGVYDIIAAAKKITQDNELKGTNIKFLIVGKGPEEHRLRDIIKKLKLDNIVKLVGFFPYSEMVELHNLADIFILPSIPVKTWQEQFGMVLIESMACGRPVISTSCGAIPEILGDAGIIIPPADPYKLAEKIKELVISKDTRLQLGIKGRLHVEKYYDRFKIAEKIKSVYEKLI
ncbi:MAG: glycosyltransferase family 4 protein [bacterium]|nr:glycosyltransferase family 4 protein [bacterium]